MSSTVLAYYLKLAFHGYVFIYCIVSMIARNIPLVYLALVMMNWVNAVYLLLFVTFHPKWQKNNTSIFHFPPKMRKSEN